MATVFDKSGAVIEEQSSSPPDNDNAAVITPLFSQALLSICLDTQLGMNPVAQSAGLEVFQMVSRGLMLVILASMH